MSLISTADAKTFMAVTGSSDDAVIAAMIAAAQDAMEAHVGRHLAAVNRTEYLDGTGGRRLWLAEPAESVASVHEDGNRSWSAATLVDAANYMLDGACLDKLDQIWTSGAKNIRVIYAAGFASPPDDVTFACKLQVARMYREWQAQKAGHNVLSDIRIESWSQSYLAREGLAQEVKDVLKRYEPERL